MSREKKPSKSIDLAAEIEKAKEKVKQLETKQREILLKERERNIKLVIALLKSEEIDVLPITVWQHAMPEIKNILNQLNASNSRIDNAGESTRVTADTPSSYRSEQD